MHLPRLAAPFFALAALSAPASSEDIHVPGDVATIQQAVTGAAPGDVVIVAPGTYNEAVDVAFKTNVTIRAAKKGKSTIASVTTAFTVSDSTAVTINGFDIESTTGVGVAIESSSDQCVLEDLEITGADGGGVTVEGVGHRIEGCEVSDSGLSGFTVNGQNTMLIDCDVENVAFDGFFVVGTQHLVSGCKAKDCGNNAVQLGNGSTPTGRCLVTDGKFDGGLGTSILVSGAFDSVIRGNKIKSPGADGIRLNSAADGVVVVDNKIQKPVANGVFVGSAVAHVLDNAIQKPGGNGIQLAAASQPARVAGNKVAGAGGDGLRVESSGSIVTDNRASKSGGFDLADSAGGNVYADNKLKTTQIDS